MFLSRATLLFPVISSQPTLCDAVADMASSSGPNKYDAPSFLVAKEQALTTANIASQNEDALASLKRRTTSIGALAHKTSTTSNPSICAFMVTLSSKGPPLDSREFAKAFNTRIIADDQRYSRFASTLDYKGEYFEHIDNFDANSRVMKTVHPLGGRDEVKNIIESMAMKEHITSPDSPPIPAWAAKVSSGAIGSSHTMSTKKVNAAVKAGAVSETVVFMRASHTIGDGVSLGSVMMDLSDERDELREMVQNEIKKRKEGKKVDKNGKKVKRPNAFQRLWRFLSNFVRFVKGVGVVFKENFRMALFGVSSPFDRIIAASVKVALEEGVVADDLRRSLSWVDAMTVDEASAVARGVGNGKSTINDLFVACVAKAVQRQLEEHKRRPGDALKDLKTDTKLKVLIPVHLTGGVLLPGQSIGNKIGAISAEVDVGAKKPHSRLLSVTSTLSIIKETPIALISFALAKLVSSPVIPTFVARRALAFGTSGASFAVSNVRGPAQALHFHGRKVESVAGFLPPPPGCPIGVVVQSYDGGISLTCNADARCVPDADKFLGWVLEEFVEIAYNGEYHGVQ